MKIVVDTPETFIIFDSFPNHDSAQAFVSEVEQRFGANGLVFDKMEDARLVFAKTIERLFGPAVEASGKSMEASDLPVDWTPYIAFVGDRDLDDESMDTVIELASNHDGKYCP
jgi:hypothetical protein